MARDSQTARLLAFPDLKPATRRDLLSQEAGTQFDGYDRMFATYANGDVLDYGTWNARDLDIMLQRDGQAAALESVLTLPIRQASRAIEKGKDDNGEADFVRSVLMAPHTAGGMKTPLQDVIGQLTSAQIYKMAFYEKCWSIRHEDGRIVYDKLAYRPPATCELKRNAQTADFDGFRQRLWLFGEQPKAVVKSSTPGYVDIKKVRAWVYINGKHRKPLTGTSELDLCYWALAYDSEVQTPSGSVPIKDIAPGDYVFGANGQPTPVLDVIPRGTRMMYRVCFKDGTSVECDADHLWGVYDTQRSPAFRYQVMSTSALREAGLDRRGVAGAQGIKRFGVPRCGPVQYPERDLPIDPYVLGAWLGDGSIRTNTAGERAGVPTFACFEDDEWIAKEIQRRLPASMKLVQSSAGVKGDYHFRPVAAYRANHFRDALVALGVNRKSPERFIPDEYLRASAEQRLDLLRGLMDTDGSIEMGISGGGNHSRYYTKSPRLAEDVQRLARSLGGTAILRTSRGRIPRVEIFAEDCPFLLPRKADCWRRGPRLAVNKIVSIEPTEEKDCRCITVGAEDGLFLTNDFIVTHNCYQTKLKIIFLWLAFIENQSLPKVVAYGNSARDAASRADDVASMRSSGVVGWEREQDPAAKTFDIIESSGKGASQFNDALSFLETWQTSSVLAGFMGLSSLASLGRGSLALSQDQSAFFLKSRQAVTAEMQEALTHDVIAPLVTLNFGPGASYPSFQFGALTDESGQALVSLFQAMAVAPSLQVPTGILDIITERLANFLNLDINAVDKIITEGAQQREAQAQAAAPPGVPPNVAAGIGKLAGGVSAADKIYRKAVAESAQAPLPEDMNQPFSVPSFGSKLP